MAFKRLCLAAVLTAAALTLSPIKHAHAQQLAPEVIEGEFQAALVMMNRGQPRVAVLILRRLLAQDPSLARVRLELARALFLAGQYQEAKQEFSIVLSSADVPTAVKQTVLGFIRRIDVARGLSTSFSIGLTAPSGAYRSYDTDEVELDFLGVPLTFELDRPDAPAFAVKVDASASRQWTIGEVANGSIASLFIRGSASLLDAPGSDFDDHLAEVALGTQLSWQRTVASAEFLETALIEAGEFSELRSGARFGGQLRRERGWLVEGQATVQQVNHQVTEGKDGQLYGASAAVQIATAGRGYVQVRLSGEYKNADENHFGYKEIGVELSRRIDLSAGISLRGSAFAKRYWQSAPTPGFLEKRNEAELGADLYAEKIDWLMGGRYIPFVSLGASRRTSSIDAFSYDEFRFGAGVRSAF